MTEDAFAELLDLYIDDALPEALRGYADIYLAAHPETQADVATLRATVARLQAASPERPDAWFTERALDRLLREHAAAQETAPFERMMTKKR